MNPTLLNRWRYFRWHLRHFLRGGKITLPKAVPLDAVVSEGVRDPLFPDESIRVYYAPGLDSIERLVQPVLTTNGLQVAPMPLTFRQLLASNGISVVRLSRTRWKVFPTSQSDRFGNSVEPVLPDPDPAAAVR